jgi:hypothetical protein
VPTVASHGGHARAHAHRDYIFARHFFVVENGVTVAAKTPYKSADLYGKLFFGKNDQRCGAGGYKFIMHIKA